MTSLEQKLINIESIEFQQGTKVVEPKEVFEAHYQGLDELIHFNEKRRKKREAEEPRRKDRNQRKERELFVKWQKTIPDNYTVNVTTKKGEEKELRVQERKNLETSFSQEEGLRGYRTRRPNILFLEDTSGDVLVLRQTKIYKPKGDVARKAQAKYGNKIDRNQYRKFWEDTTHTINTNRYLLLPEPNLVVATEQLYQENIIDRVTPVNKPVYTDKENRSHYVLRPYLDSIRSRPTTMEAVARYLAGLHSVGLSDERDRQKEHYCIQQGQTSSIVNIDPDFFIYIGEKPQRISDDTKNFFSLYAEMDQTVFTTDSNEFKQLKRRIQKEYGDRRKEFIDILPKTISEVAESYHPLLR